MLAMAKPTCDDNQSNIETVYTHFQTLRRQIQNYRHKSLNEKQ
jgi:hypothetical protein